MNNNLLIKRGLAINWNLIFLKENSWILNTRNLNQVIQFKGTIYERTSIYKHKNKIKIIRNNIMALNGVQ